MAWQPKLFVIVLDLVKKIMCRKKKTSRFSVYDGMCQSFHTEGYESTKMTQKKKTRQSRKAIAEKSCELVQSWHTDLVKYEKLYKVMTSKQNNIPFYYKLQE